MPVSPAGGSPSTKLKAKSPAGTKTDTPSPSQRGASPPPSKRGQTSSRKEKGGPASSRPKSAKKHIKKIKKKPSSSSPGGVGDAAEVESQLEDIAEDDEAVDVGDGDDDARFAADLSKMKLEDNFCTELPDKLAELIVADCFLAALPAVIANFKHLTKLDASGNQLTALPAELSSCTTLQSLELYSNKIKELPVEISNLTGLRVLNLFNNAIRKLPEGVGQLACLEELNCAGNKLMMLTDAHFERLSGITVLTLYENNLVRLGSLAPLASLEELRLSYNNLEEMPTLAGGGHPSLTVIEMHKNRVATIPEAYFASLPALQRLSIWGNMLTALPPSLAALTGLVGLQAHENKLESIPPSSWPATLETLFLHDNEPLVSLPPTLVDCAALRRVNVANLKLDEESAEVAESLKQIVLVASEGIYWGPDGGKLVATPP